MNDLEGKEALCLRELKKTMLCGVQSISHYHDMYDYLIRPCLKLVYIVMHSFPYKEISIHYCLF